MEDFLNNLYSYDNFGIYLIIAIIVLVVLFFVILFFGNKDKKKREIEETKRLQKLSPDLFKLDETEQKLEVKPEEGLTQASVTEITPIVNNEPVINKEEEIKPLINNEPVAPIVPEQPVTPVINLENEAQPAINLAPVTPVQEPVNEPILTKVEQPELVINSEPEIKPVMTESLETPVSPSVEENKNEELAVPDFNFDDILNGVNEVKAEETPEVKMPEVKEEIVEPEVKEDVKLNKGPEIFSSVYVPESTAASFKEEKKVVVDDDIELDLPMLKSEEKKEIKEEIPNEPIVKDYDLNSIVGETYDINR